MIGKGSTQFASLDENYQHKYSAVVLGGRTALTFRKHALGVDYSQQSHYLDGDLGGVESEDKVNRNQLGAYYGYSFSRLSLHLNYFFKARMEGSDEATPLRNQIFIKGTELMDGAGLGAGLSFRWKRFINLNLTYRAFSYKTLEQDGIEDKNFKGTKLSEVLMSISFPFGFGRK